MSKFQVGQKVRVIGDTFKQDPHNVEIGTVVEVHSISPEVPFEQFDPFMKLLFAMNGIEPFDLPERVHVKLGDNEFEDYANLIFEDVELVEDDGKFKVRMLEDDVADGYFEGDVLEAYYSPEHEEYVFVDCDGDERPLDVHEHERV
jgi:hypothetical protein